MAKTTFEFKIKDVTSVYQKGKFALHLPFYYHGF